MDLASSNTFGVVSLVGAFCAERVPKDLPHRWNQDCAQPQEGSGEPEADLQALLRRTQESDPMAAEELIHRVYPLVLRIVRRNLARRDSEEDVVQEILVKVLSGLHSFKERAPFEHWVCRIAINACLNRLRAERVRPEWRWADLPEAQAEALDALACGKQISPDEELSLRDVVDHLLENLAPKDRLIVRLMEIEGWTVKEICSRTGWSGTFVRVRAFRARQKLNRQFREQWKRGEL